MVGVRSLNPSEVTPYMKHNRVAIIGSGATAVYTLKYLIKSKQPLDITLFESSNEVGKGMPYRSDMNADYMLCNAFSKEIPLVTRSLIDWLEHLPKRELGEWELSSHELSARAFYPRLLIGEFLADEFQDLCKKANSAGHNVKVKPGERVTDIIPSDQDTVTLETSKAVAPTQYDHVIIATGHSWPAHPKLNDADLLSPWPYTNITKLAPGNIGILGSSLSAIDIVVALATAHGEFIEENGTVTWQPNNPNTKLKITMVSKDGIMPEGDFYYPYPYQSLKLFSREAVDTEINKGNQGLLQRLFELLCDELNESDPDYFKTLGQQSKSVEEFSKAYFKRRKELGGLAAVKLDFATARKSLRERKTIPYRYVLLRAHENFDRALRSLDNDDYALFKKTLLPVFADSYAAVPHLSLARIIAMFDANVLELKASGENADFRNTENNAVIVETEEETLKFDVLIDARGQSAAPLDELPFPSLVKVLLAEQSHVESPFRLKTAKPSSIYCLALPQLLQRYPFSQGLANSDENAKTVAADFFRHSFQQY
jgi:uncharacterized NAD(P)/FAD-binding protein YdhS